MNWTYEIAGPHGFAELKGVFANEQNRVNSFLQEDETSGWGVAHFTAGMSYKKLTAGEVFKTYSTNSTFVTCLTSAIPFGPALRSWKLGLAILSPFHCGYDFVTPSEYPYKFEIIAERELNLLLRHVREATLTLNTVNGYKLY